MKGIADTGFIVAFGNRNDRHHAWALDIAKGITEPLLTCEAVLAEAAFHLASSSYVLSLVHDAMLRVTFDCSRNLEHLMELATRYQDRQPDFARGYRRNKRGIIPLLCPSKTSPPCRYQSSLERTAVNLGAKLRAEAQRRKTPT